MFKDNFDDAANKDALKNLIINVISITNVQFF